MLISAFTFDTNILALDTYTGAMPQRSHLLLWGVDTDTLQLLVPNGVGGSFFSDGETLAAITLGQAQLDEMGRFAAPSGKQIQPEDHPYLYLLDMDSQKVSLGLPVHTFSGALEYIQLQGWADAAGIPFWYPDYSLGDPFSPDNRFLAILTPGKVINNEKGQPVDVETDLQNALYLNILDLQTLKVIHSVPTWDEKPLWSPKSERVLFREPDGNWSLLEIASGETRPITLSGGEDFERAAWSHDGRYLALYRHRQTVIILVSP